MVVWINGAFGVGKSATAVALAELDPTLHLFDPESVGFMLQANLHGREIDDFQHLSAWRALVPAVARHLADFTGQSLIAVQTVLIEEYWRELVAGMRDLGLEVFHVLLDADDAALESRIRADEHERLAEGWRLDHATIYRERREWMRRSADLVVDTTSVSAMQAAAAICTAMAEA